MKKTNRQKKEKELDMLWQQVVTKRANYRCELIDQDGVRCSRETSCGHHIILKSASRALRWRTDNGIGICLNCHYGVHGSRYSGKYMLFIINKIGITKYKELWRTSQTISKFTLKDLDKIKEKLTNEY